MVQLQSSAALLVMDMQNSVISRYTRHESDLQPFRQALEAARKHNIPVIYVGVAVNEEAPAHPRNKIFGRMSGNIGMTSPNPAMHVHDSVRPLPGEPLVDKFRVSAFSHSNLEELLRSRGIDRLILSGIATSGVVLSTLCEAADKDYSVMVLSDACLDADPEVHRVLIEKVFPRQADVLTVEEWSNQLINNESK